MIKVQDVQKAVKDLLLNSEFVGDLKITKEPIFNNKKCYVDQKGKIQVIGDKVSCTVINYQTGSKKSFRKTKAQKKVELLKFQQTKLEDEFDKLNPVTTHPYLEKKQVSLPKNHTIKKVDDEIIVPMQGKEGQIISWQRIFPNGDKKNKYGHSLPEIYFCIIGGPSERIYVTEGLADALSIHEITGEQVYICFTKAKIDILVKHLLDKFKTKLIVRCVDNDNEDTLNTKLSSDRAITLCPNKKGDFNDHQFVEEEKQKLINLEPTYEPKELPKYVPDANPVLDLKSRLTALNYEIRLNTRKDAIEIKIKDKWVKVTDEFQSNLFYEVQELKDSKGDRAKLKKAEFEECIKALSYQNQVEPFKKYLSEIEWDGEQRIGKLLSTCFKVKEGYEKLAEWAGEAIFLAPVWRTYHPGKKHDEMIILKGAQGIGKSLFLYSLFKDKSLFSNTVNFSDPYQKIVEIIMDKCICEVAELQGFGKTALDKMKNIISTQQDTVRLSYRKHPKDYLRKCIFVGSTNDQTPLPPDITGLRRFVMIALEYKKTQKELEELLEKNRDQYWSEAVHLYKEGKSSRLPKELWKVSAKVAEENRGGNLSFEEQFIKHAEQMYEATGYISIPEVLKKMKDGNEIMGENDKVLRVGGGWIKDITPTLQSYSAEILVKNGYKKKKKTVKGQQFRIWVKEDRRDTEKVNVPPKDTKTTPPCPF